MVPKMGERPGRVTADGRALRAEGRNLGDYLEGMFSWGGIVGPKGRAPVRLLWAGSEVAACCS